MAARTRYATALFAAAAWMTGCSLALDIDALQAGSSEDTDTAPGCTTAADCDDGIDCTVDSCGEDGHCDSTPDNDLCDYLSYCDEEQGCVPTGDECKVASDCDDGIDCTVDSCVIGGESDNYCVNEPDDSVCESADPCIEGELCSPETGCYEGAPKVCPPATAPCMDAECDPLTGECEDVYVAGYDDDDDGYLDEACGGDDCDDDEEEVHPSAAESCNGVDDDCDGFTDISMVASAVTVTTATTLASPSLAYDGETYAVTWQQGDDASGEVYARFIGPTGAMVSDPHNYTALGGTGAIGTTPHIAAAADGFLAIWISSVAPPAARVLMVPLSVDTGSGAVSQGTLETLDDGTADAVFAPRVGWDDPSTGSGWVAAWAAEWSGGDRTIELRAQDMHSTVSDTFTVSAGAGAVDTLSLAVLGADDYALAFGRVGTGTDDDLEVFETRVVLDADAWAHAAGFPAMISSVDPTNDDDSWQPEITLDGAGGWITAFTDTEVLGATAFTRNIMAWDQTSLEPLQASDSYMQTDPAFEWNGAFFGLLYLSSVGSSTALEWRQFSDALALPPSPYAGTRFSLTSGAQDLRSPRLVANDGGGFAAIVVYDDGTADNLRFYAFEGCDAGAK